jgi:hypothetical protein
MAFQPGQSGNPGGRRKEKPYRDALRKALAELAADEAPSPRTNLEAVIRAHVERAKGGDVQAIAHIADRLDGKVPQAIVGDEDEAPVKHEFAWAKSGE